MGEITQEAECPKCGHKFEVSVDVEPIDYGEPD